MSDLVESKFSDPAYQAPPPTGTQPREAVQEGEEEEEEEDEDRVLDAIAGPTAPGIIDWYRGLRKFYQVIYIKWKCVINLKL